MKFKFRHGALIAVLIFLALFLLRLSVGDPVGVSNTFINNGFLPQQNGEMQNDAIQSSRRNYATAGKSKAAPPTQPLGNAQKYEQIASVGATSLQFEEDRRKVDEQIKANSALIQLEQLNGLSGRRSLSLSIGVPPEKFDSLLVAVQAIGRTTSFSLVRNDKTNEYQQLRAKRASLERARGQLETLQSTGGTIDERLHVQERLSQIEGQIQDLGVALGEFDSENEFVTIRLSLVERAAVQAISIATRLINAFEWTAWVYLGLGFGFFGLAFGTWIAAITIRVILGVIRNMQAAKEA